MGKQSSKSSASVPRGYQFSAPPQTRAAVEGVLVDPAQTTDDFVEKVVESSPAFSLLASRATPESDFDQLAIKTYSFVWAIPHLLKTTATELADDERGAIVELLQSGCSFRNVSNDEITIHANTPVALQKSPDNIYARLSGFFAKGAKGKKTDDVHLKPGQTATYKVNWKNLPNEYTPLMEASSGRLWMNMLNFAVEIKNINQQTGAAPNDLASIISMIPKTHYTKRKSNPLVPSGQTLVMQDTENYALQLLPNGADDLFSVHPISVQGGGMRGGNPITRFRTDHPIVGTDPDGASYFIADAANEGDLIGVAQVNITRADYKQDDEDVCNDGQSRSYQGAGLVVQRVGGNARPLELQTRQGGGSRLIVMGFNIAASPSSSPVFYSYWKWDPNVGHWVLWDDFEQAPRYAPGNLANFTPITAYVPICYITGVYTFLEREAMHKALMEFGKNEFGQPFGDPRGFGTFLRKAISVLAIVGQVAGYLATLL